MSLKITVLIKQVPDHEAIVQIGADGTLDIEDRYVCSFFDEIAIEAALDVRKANPGAEILALSVGGKRSVESLRRAMAMGLDQVEQLGDDSMDSTDGLAVASLLAARLKTFNPDLVLAGKQAGDDDMGAVGPMVSGLMGMPLVNAATSMDVDVDGGKVRVTHSMNGETWTVESGFPVVVTAQKGLAEPHVPVVMRVMKAMRAKITNTSLEDLGVSEVDSTGRLERLGYHLPPVRPQVQMVGDVNELVAVLEQRGVI
jgi:electron transfer flavoprotein beta subunit